MIGYNVYCPPATKGSHTIFQDMFLGTKDIHGMYKGEVIIGVGWDSVRLCYIVTTEKNEGEEMTYHNVNGDVVEATSTGDVFLYLGGMFYNLSSGRSEMRGRKSIKRSDGPIRKLSNITNSGDLFKEAIAETHPARGTEMYEVPF